MRAIRLEYQHYPEDAYRKGRAAVLKGFLGRERLFFSSVAETEGWEERARENLEYEIGLLENGKLD